MSGFRAGDGQELYLIPQVKVPPNEVSEEDGAEPTIPAPSSTNRSPIQLSTTGDAINDIIASDDEMPVTVNVEARNRTRFVDEKTGETREDTVTTFSITNPQKSNQEYHENWWRWPLPGAEIFRFTAPTDPELEDNFNGMIPNRGPTEDLGDWRGVGDPAWIVDPINGDLKFFALYRKEDAPGAGDLRIKCFSYHQRTGGAEHFTIEMTGTFEFTVPLPWIHCGSSDPLETAAPTGHGLPTLDTPNLTAAVLDEDIYLFVSDAKETAPASAGFYVFLYCQPPNTTLGTYSLITGPVTAPGTGIVMSHMSATASRDRINLAAEVHIEEPSLGTIRTNINTGSTVDLEHWSDLDDTHVLTELGEHRIVADPNVHEDDFAKNFNALWIAEDIQRESVDTPDTDTPQALVGVAVSNGAIYTTEDGGQTWEKPKAFRKGETLESIKNINFHGVHCSQSIIFDASSPPTVDEHTFIVVGSEGTVVRGVVESGTWEILNTVNEELAEAASITKPSKEVGSINLQSVVTITEPVGAGGPPDPGVISEFWMCGEGYIGYGYLDTTWKFHNLTDNFFKRKEISGNNSHTVRAMIQDSWRWNHVIVLKQDTSGTFKERNHQIVAAGWNASSIDFNEWSNDLPSMDPDPLIDDLTTYPGGRFIHITKAGYGPGIKSLVDTKTWDTPTPLDVQVFDFERIDGQKGDKDVGQVLDLFSVGPDEFWASGELGMIRKWTRTPSGGLSLPSDVGLFTEIEPPLKRSIIDIFAGTETDPGRELYALVQASPFIYESMDGGDTWTAREVRQGVRSGTDARAFSGQLQQTLPTSLTANPVTTIRAYPVRVLSDAFYVAAGLSVLTGANGIHYSGIRSQNRVYPSVLTLDDNSILMACANLDNGVIEIWRSDDGGQTYSLVDNGDNASVRFPKIDMEASTAGGVDFTEDDLVDFNAASVVVPRPSLVKPIFQNHVYLTAGLKGIVSLDNGLTWIEPDDARVPFPLGDLVLNSGVGMEDAVDIDEDQVKKTRISIAYGGGRLFSSLQTPVTGGGGIVPSQYGVYVSREIQGESSVDDPVRYPTRFMPIAENVPMYIGLGDIKIIFSGIPLVMDAWTISRQFRFGADNMNIDSPSVFYRSVDNAEDIFMQWNRQHPDIVELLGDGSHWEMTAAALFGTNFRKAKLAITLPDFDSVDGSGDPVDFPEGVNPDYTELDLISDCDYGIADSILAHSTSADGSIVIDPGKQWVHGQFAPSYRTFYFIALDDNGDEIAGSVAKILNNDATSLMLDRKITETGVEGKSFVIFGDRMFTDGSNGVRGVDTSAPALLDSAYRFGGIIRLKVPAQATVHGDRRIGTAIFGTHTPVERERGDTTKRRHRYTPGFRWQVSQTAILSNGLGGQSAVEHFGRARQVWSLNYQEALWWDRDMNFNGLYPLLRQAFCVVFDNKNKHSVELVRLNQDPNFSNTPGDRYNYPVQLIEVP